MFARAQTFAPKLLGISISVVNLKIPKCLGSQTCPKFPIELVFPAITYMISWIVLGSSSMLISWATSILNSRHMHSWDESTKNNYPMYLSDDLPASKPDTCNLILNQSREDYLQHHASGICPFSKAHGGSPVPAQHSTRQIWNEPHKRCQKRCSLLTFLLPEKWSLVSLEEISPPCSTPKCTLTATKKASTWL